MCPIALHHPKKLVRTLSLIFVSFVLHLIYLLLFFPPFIDLFNFHFNSSQTNTFHLLADFDSIWSLKTTFCIHFWQFNTLEKTLLELPITDTSPQYQEYLMPHRAKPWIVIQKYVPFSGNYLFFQHCKVWCNVSIF